MARTIKRVSHDLLPLSEGNSELSSLIATLLDGIAKHVSFDDPKSKRFFDECIEASQKMAISAKLIRSYVIELDKEAENEGILKD